MRHSLYSKQLSLTLFNSVNTGQSSDSPTSTQLRRSSGARVGRVGYTIHVHHAPSINQQQLSNVKPPCVKNITTSLTSSVGDQRRTKPETPKHSKRRVFETSYQANLAQLLATRPNVS